MVLGLGYLCFFYYRIYILNRFLNIIYILGFIDVVYYVLVMVRGCYYYCYVYYKDFL